MRKLFTFIVTVLIMATGWAQSPEKMSYQAVIRDAGDNLVTNQTVGMQISILQGSITGTAVYVETQTPATNANGLISVEIGNGTVLSGDFTTIDWENGPSFIKTETDPSGGSNYTITGTSQLLSVPYALHAKTAEKVTGGIIETDPVYTGSQASSITAAEITKLNNLSGVNTGDQDLGTLATKTALGDSVAQVRSKIPDVSGIATNTQAIQDTALQIRADILTVTTYSVGDFAQGGIVFWVDETGQHGLVVSKVDQSTGIRWYAGTNGVTRATGDGLFSGELNTSIIISSQVSIGDDGSDYAAQICNNLKVTENGNTYGDWYLPSNLELNLMCQNQATINATAVSNGGSALDGVYWSSTETSNMEAVREFFSNCYQSDGSKFNPNRVRAIRSF